MRGSTFSLQALVILGIILAGARAQVFHSGGNCTAIATSASWRTVREAFASAAAEASATGCSAEDGKNVLKAFAEVFFGMAEAMAQVFASAVARCDTTGNAYACAASKGSAKSFARSQVKLYAKAFAEAINQCPKCAANAQSYIEANLLVDLVAQATAVTEAQVCIGPNSTAFAEAYGACTATVIAQGYAKALAKAMIKGGCFNAQALADVEASLQVDVTNYCTCTAYAYVDGEWAQAEANTSNDCYAIQP